VLDCYQLIVDWYAQERGVTLPQFARADEWWNDGKSDLYTEGFPLAGFTKLPEGAALQAGDVILMQIRARNGVPNHAAIYLGDGLILHHLHGRLSSRDVYGGMWAENTRAVVRHRS
jgi:cell wall-associated NlpC family hydrolase